MKLRDFKGKSVVSIDQGQKVGTVLEAILHSLQVTDLVLKGEHGEGLLPFRRIHSIGQDAITVQTGAEVEWNKNTSEPGSISGEAYLKLPVVDTQGTVIGEVHDAIVGPSGAVESIEVRRGGVFGIGAHETVIPRANVRAVGEKLITVDGVTAE